MDIAIINNGPLIVDTNFWGSPREQNNGLYVSVHAGVIRILMPRTKTEDVRAVEKAKYVVLSRGPWEGRSDAMQFTFTGAKPIGYVMIPSTSADIMVAKPEPGQEWIVSVWISRGGAPYKAMQLPCKWRSSNKLPDNSPWQPWRGK